MKNLIPSMAAPKPTNLRLDRALDVGQALEGDLLDRRPFAAQVVKTLEAVTGHLGLVMSIEGSWGSGKSSVLAMVEELLQRGPEATRPVVVHFNPWLIGDRDALLRQFLSSIAKQVKLTDHAKEGKRVGKELKTYAKAFDLLKLVPGAEPWASLVKSVVESAGEATTAVFDHKTPDIEAHKHALENALRKFPRRIVVLIDDVDRLFAAEVFEMVRIVKVVGDLPNVGYVLAWDEKYVSSALDKLSVPLAHAYLDKVVQVRMRVPPLSFPQRIALMNLGMQRLEGKAHRPYFVGSDERHGELFHAGLGELLEHPRDFVRLFDVVISIEPGLRGEIQLSDVIAMAALMTKAPKVYDLLHAQPQAFVGRRPGAKDCFKEAKDVLAEHKQDRDAAIDGCVASGAVRQIVQWLFPDVASPDAASSWGRREFSEGHLAHPDRLLVALQLSARPNDVSLKEARDFILHPERRESIAASLTEEMCAEFVGAVGSLSALLVTQAPDQVEPLAMAVARLAEGKAFAARARHRRSVLARSGRLLTMGVIAALVKGLDPGRLGALAEQLVGDVDALSVATTVAIVSFVGEDRDFPLKVPAHSKERALASWAANVERAIDEATFFDRPDVGWMLWEATRLVPDRCADFFSAIQRQDPTLDRFAEQIFRFSFDSHKGQIYGVPADVERVERYAALTLLKRHAEGRLSSTGLSKPVVAAWRSVVEGRQIYGKDGSDADY
jgi:hypothetical protein